MKKKYCYLFMMFSLGVFFYACTSHATKKDNETKALEKVTTKSVVYQVFTRLFGNKKTANIPWGTIEENGVGKFNDFTVKALQEIKNLGVTHIWYTGVLHHALVNDYTAYGITNDDPDVVKGRAGSPYAVKDYYNVNPDLAVDPSNRLEEFKALIARSHKVGLKVIIDIVPNHVARNYQSITAPAGTESFGASDDVLKTYTPDNNFYYNPKEKFQLPYWQDDYQPLGGDVHELVDGKFEEYPAKWTGNGARSSQPDQNDWYETVKVNYGVSPEGHKDFEALPEAYENANFKEHYKFWNTKKVPDSWNKFKDIALYWIANGVDGFRYDMAEMVPVEFWSYMNSAIKMKNSNAFLMAEVYNPDLYRSYIHQGKMDYLYDKVAMYDSIKRIMKGDGSTGYIPSIRDKFQDIEPHMLYFLENHDEQRIASPEFVGNATTAKPAMTVMATLGTAPVMIYFGQEVGESGAQDAGFGKPSRTSIFDYVGVPHHQRWMNNGAFDGGQLTEEETALRDFYKRLLNITISNEALMGESQEIHRYNKDHTEYYNERVFSYVRYSNDEKLIVVVNFDTDKQHQFELRIPKHIISNWQLRNAQYELTDLLYEHKNSLKLKEGEGFVAITLKPLETFIFKIEDYTNLTIK